MATYQEQLQRIRDMQPGATTAAAPTAAPGTPQAAPTRTMTPDMTSRSGRSSAGPRGGTIGGGGTPIGGQTGLTDPGLAGAPGTRLVAGGGTPNTGMGQEQARQILMNNSSGVDNPQVWEAYQMIYGRPHQASPEGQAAGGSAGAKQAAIGNATPYTDFASTGGNQSYSGKSSVDAAAGIEGFNFEDALNNPAAQGNMQYQLPEGVDASKYNENMFLSEDSGNWLAEQLGWDYTPASSSQSPHFGQMPKAGYFTDPNDPDTQHGAAVVAQRYERAQSNYTNSLQNYERNLAQNPNIVGTGFLSKPGDIFDNLKAGIAGNPSANTNEAGGNQGIYDALAQGNNAFGDPLGAGGPNADYSNAPVGDNNPIDQSTQPGTQTGQPGADSPFTPQGPSPGAGPGGTGNPGYPGWIPGGSGNTGLPPGDTSPGGNAGNGQPPGGGGQIPTGYGSASGPDGYGGGQLGGGWNPSPPGGPGGGPGGYQQPQSLFNPQTFGGGWQSNPGNPWAQMGQQGGGMQSLGQLLQGIQALRSGGQGMGGGYNPFSGGFGGGMGPYGGGGQGGMMSMIPQRPPMLPGAGQNQNYYGLQ